MAFRLSDLNAVTASIGTDLLHLRTVAGLDKKITNTNLFNTIPTLTTYGQTILARDGGHVEIANNGINIYPEFLQSVAESNDIHASIGKSENGGSLYPFTQSGHLLLQARADFLREIILLGQDGEPGLTFFGDSKNVSIGGALDVDSGARFLAAINPGSLPSISSSTVGIIQNNGTTVQSSGLSIIGGSAAFSDLNLGDDSLETSGRVRYNNSTKAMLFQVNSSEAMRIFSNGNLSINNTSNLATLHVDGDFRVTGTTHPFIVKPTGFLDDTWMDGTLYVDTIAEKTGSAGVTIAGTTGNATFNDLGNRLDVSVSGAYAIKNTDAAGYMRFVTGNRINNDVSANLVLNLDQSVTVNTTLYVDTIAEKTAAAGVTIDGFTIKDGGFVVSGVVVKMKVLSQPYTSASLIQVTHGVNAANIRGVSISNSTSRTVDKHSTGTTFIDVYLSSADTGTIYVTLFYI